MATEGPQDKYLETLNFVVNFLHEEGFHKAHSVLLQEFNTRLNASASPSAEGVVFASRQSVSACSAPPSTFEYGERAAESLSPPRSKSAQAGPSWEGFPGPVTVQKSVSTAGAVEHGRSAAPTSAAASPPASAPPRPARRRMSRPSGHRQQPIWDGEVDDYESMDDPGYSRREVPGQSRFAELELDACSEDGSERAYFMHQPGDLNYDDIESEVSASDPEGITAASSMQSGQFGAFGDAHDETWDLGPTDIKFAEPVTTPSRSPEKQESEERRPVLSRVESLSSSFKDFEMERGFNADGEAEGQLSSKVSESEYTADPEVIDFPVTVVNHEDVELFRQRRPSPTSSIDVAGGSMAPSVAPSEQQGTEGQDSQERGRCKGAAKPTNLLKALTAGRNSETRADGAVGAAAAGHGAGTSAAGGGAAAASGGAAGPSSGAFGGGAGGFSFPITPPSDEPEQRLFTSWPSVRSSCTSEPVAMLDVDGALPAEYADDEYSKYRLSSRSASIAAHDYTSERKTAEGASSGAPASPDGASTSGGLSPGGPSVDAADVALEWEFKIPANDLISAPREPSLEFSASRSAAREEDGSAAGTPTAAGSSAAGTAQLTAPAAEAEAAFPCEAGADTAPSADAGAEAAVAAGAEPEAEASVGVNVECSVDALESQHDAVTLTGELDAPEGLVQVASAAPVVVLQPPQVEEKVAGLSAQEEGQADAQAAVGPAGPAAAEVEAESASLPEEKGESLSQLTAHRILFEAEELGTEPSHEGGCGGADAEHSLSYGGAGGADAGSSSHLSQQEQEQREHERQQRRQGRLPPGPAPGFGERHDPDGDAATFSEPASYDGNEADVDEPLDEQGSALDEHEAEELGGGGRRGGDEEGAAGPWSEEERLHATDFKDASLVRPESSVMPRYHMDEHGNVMYEYENDYIDKKYEVFELRIIHRRHRTGFEETKDFPIRLNDLIAGRYQVMDFLGSAAFSRAVQALDVKTGQLVCLKIIKNNKDYFDQSLDEIKLLKYVNSMDPNDEFAIVRLYDFFYYKEHLFLVCELLRANLYEFQKYNKESGDELYFTNARIQRIARQALRSLAFLHSLGLIHSDLKPENILIKSYSRCEVKVIDLGSSCFITDQLSSYVQSRSYRAPEVILGLPYDYKVDVWSLGCILAELSSGYVLFQNDSLATLLARLEGILGPIPEWMLHKGRYAHRFYTRSGMLYERSSATQRYELLLPKRTSLRHRMPDADDGLLEFVSYLLTADPRKRPTAAEALKHPWLQQEYPAMDA